MRRVVVTGMGIVSSIGTNKGEVLASLRSGRSGIEFAPEYQALGFRSQVHGPIRVKREELIDRKLLRFMGDGAAYTYIAMRRRSPTRPAREQVSHKRTGMIVGSGGGSPQNLVEAADTARQGREARSAPTWCRACMSAPYRLPRDAFNIKGVNYSISSACATSAHCIGNACEQIQWGKQDIVFAGGGEEVHLPHRAVRRHGRAVVQV